LKRNLPDVLRINPGVRLPDRRAIERDIEAIHTWAVVDAYGLIGDVGLCERQLDGLADLIGRLIRCHAVSQVGKQLPDFEPLNAQRDLASHLRVLSLGFARVFERTADNEPAICFAGRDAEPFGSSGENAAGTIAEWPGRCKPRKFEGVSEPGAVKIWA
jgi:hypothetical protein